MKTVWILQHVPFEGPGAYAPRLLSLGYTPRFHRCWENPSLPDLGDVDAVVAMGGPMSVNDETEHPWLVEEKQWLQTVMSREIPVIGVCLGAQCMAAALGAEVRKNDEKEIGWWPVWDVRHPHADPVNVLHWHGETFDLPDDAVHLEKSTACLHQSFQWGERAVGLQYHIEATRESLQLLIEHSRHELSPGRFVQTEKELWTGWDRHHGQAGEKLDRICQQVLMGN